MGMVIIVWTIRLSLLCFFATLFGWTWRRDDKRFNDWLRITWTLGFVLFVAHVLSAFHFHHHWDHQAAINETASQTRETIGLEFGGGVYFNHLFMCVWGLHVVWLWTMSGAIRFRQLELAGLLYLFFIAFNGTAIFKTGWLRASGVAAMLILICGLLLRFNNQFGGGVKAPKAQD